MPFLAAVKEAKLRTFVAPGQSLVDQPKLVHEGSGYAMTEASITSDGKPICDAAITFRVTRISQSELSPSKCASAPSAIGLPSSEALAEWLTRRAKPGSPASASSPASAKGSRRIGRN